MLKFKRAIRVERFTCPYCNETFYVDTRGKKRKTCGKAKCQRAHQKTKIESIRTKAKKRRIFYPYTLTEFKKKLTALKICKPREPRYPVYCTVNGERIKCENPHCEECRRLKKWE